MIKPIVNVSKIIDNYNVIVCGFDGVLTDGAGVKSEAITALVNMKKNGKKIVVLSNSPWRVAKIVRFLHANKVPVALFDAVVSAGEILHYKLKTADGVYGALGRRYCHLGDRSERGVFDGLDFTPVDKLENAEFLYMSSVKSSDDYLDNYLPELEHAAALGLPLLVAGNDTSCHIKGKISVAPGALAEQYAVLGGRIVTVGKPAAEIFSYALDGMLETDPRQILVIGDNLNTDIKGANLINAPSALISKGIHVNYLGEGYIPDVAKTRELSINFDAYPDYVISNLRW